MTMELSPVKVSKRNPCVCYFDGKMSDGRKSVRVVSFAPSLRSALESSCTKGSSVIFVNYHVKAAGGSSRGQDGAVEIVAMKVEASPGKFDISSTPVDEEPTQVELSNMDGLGAGQLITVKVKWLKLGQMMRVKL